MGPDREVPQEALAPDNSAALQLLLLSLKALSQRALVALASLSVGAAVASVWLLFYDALPVSPSAFQLVGLGMYAVFVLAVLWIQGARR